MSTQGSAFPWRPAAGRRLIQSTGRCLFRDYRAVSALRHSCRHVIASPAALTARPVLTSCDRQRKRRLQRCHGVSRHHTRELVDGVVEAARRLVESAAYVGSSQRPEAPVSQGPLSGVRSRVALMTAESSEIFIGRQSSVWHSQTVAEAKSCCECVRRKEERGER